MLALLQRVTEPSVRVQLLDALLKRIHLVRSVSASCQTRRCHSTSAGVARVPPGRSRRTRPRPETSCWPVRALGNAA